MSQFGVPVVEVYQESQQIMTGPDIPLRNPKVVATTSS
jgi:hypothetical protein